MADNVAITAGSGTNIATDDVAGVQYQRVKLVDGTADSSTVIPGSGSGLYVQGDVAHDSPVAANPLLVAGRSSAAAPTDVSADGDVVRAWFLRNGAQAAVLTAAGALIGGDATNGLDVDVTRVTGTVTVDSELAASTTMGDFESGPSTAPVWAFGMLWNGSQWARSPGSTTGTFVQGNVAHDSPVSSNPLLMGGYAASSAPTNVTNGDAVRAWFLQNGSMVVNVAAGGTLITGDSTGLDVDVNRIIPGSTATALGKAEDAAHTTGDVGVLSLGVRSDTQAILSDTTGDYTPYMLDSRGSVYVMPTPKQIRVTVTPTISNGVAYTSGDCVGGLQTISNAARISGGTGTIVSVLVFDKTQAQRAAMDLLFFDRSVTVAGDNAAVAMSDGDMANCLGVISIGPYNTAWPGTPLNSISTLFNIGLPFVLNGTDLFCQAVVRGTPTYTSTSDLLFIYTILQD